jgi:hypothetical protein
MPKNKLFNQIDSYPPWLPERTIFLCRAGSHAYGTNIESSDEDYRGIAIAPKRYFYGFVHSFDQFVSKQVDLTIFGLQKYLHLAANANPNVIELLFTAPEDQLYVAALGNYLRDIKDLFISKKCRFTFSGYAMGQLKRINTHHRWIMNPPDHKPTRAEFELPDTTLLPKDQLGAAETAIKKKIESWELGLDDLEEADKINLQSRIATYLAELKVGKDFEWEIAARSIGYDENFLELLAREKRYRSVKSDWDKYQNWLKTRNPARAELEAKYGFDTKHAMHLVRLLRMCEEILSGDGVIVKRPDAKELLEIRNGAWTYDQLIEWASAQDAKMAELYETSSLPKKPDRKKIDDICVDIVKRSFTEGI